MRVSFLLMRRVNAHIDLHIRTLSDQGIRCTVTESLDTCGIDGFDGLSAALLTNVDPFYFHLLQGHMYVLDDAVRNAIRERHYS